MCIQGLGHFFPLLPPPPLPPTPPPPSSPSFTFLIHEVFVKNISLMPKYGCYFYLCGCQYSIKSL
jgi:hypothetical protein